MQDLPIHEVSPAVPTWLLPEAGARSAVSAASGTTEHYLGNSSAEHDQRVLLLPDNCSSTSKSFFWRRKKKKNTQIIRPSKQLYLNPVTVALAPDEGGNLIFLLNLPALISLLARPSPPHNKAVFQRAGPADGHAFLGAGKHGAQRLQHTRPYTQGIPRPPKPLVSFTSSLDRAAFLLVRSHACAGRNLERWPED